jgi:hypothetical protein
MQASEERTSSRIDLIPPLRPEYRCPILQLLNSCNS